MLRTPQPLHPFSAKHVWAAALLIGTLLGLQLTLFTHTTVTTRPIAVASLFHVSAAAAQESFSCADVTEIPQIECRALVALYDKTDGANWIINSGWLTANAVCSWYGVSCAANHVVGLQLPGNGLHGTLPVELGALRSLQVLDLAAEAPALTAQRADPAPDAVPQQALTELHTVGEIAQQVAVDVQRQRVEATTVYSATLQLHRALDPSLAATDTAPYAAGSRADLAQRGNNPLLSEDALRATLAITETATALRRQLAAYQPERHARSVLAHSPALAATAATAVAQILSEHKATAQETTAQETTTDQATTNQATTVVNQISGPLPPSLGNLSNLQYLDLTGNGVSGPIPSELGLMHNLSRLLLFNNALTGSIPPELGNLTNLQVLDLGVNQLSGAIPPELGNLTNLVALGLCGNGLTGAIPPRLGELHNVTILLLCYNGLSGAIPAELANLSSVITLRLDVNRLRGTIPVALGNLPHVQVLRLEQNELSGAIPESLGNLQSLAHLNLSLNRLSGSIPATLGELSNLTGLALWENRLSGSIPPQLGQLTNLQILSLMNNDLSGTIPTELSNITQLQMLDLSGNGLTGSIPPWITELSALRWLYLANNRLSGSLPTDLAGLTHLEQLMLFNNQLTGTLPATIGSLPALTQLMVDNNQLRGPLPPELGNLTQLSALRLGANRFTGSIPEPLGNLPALQELWLQYNQLQGSIPATLGNLTNLQTLWLNNNQLQGELPATLGNLIQLTSLYAHNNHFTGTIPTQLGNLAALKVLSLNDNFLTGTIPPALGGLSQLQRLWLGNNQLHGPIPTELAHLANLQQLWLALNQLSGPIPPELGTLANLQQLVLAVNYLSGEIPPQLAALSELTQLALRANLLTGALPPQLGNLSKLRSLWLDDNHFSGALPPALGQLTNLTELRLDGNQFTGTIPPEWETLANLQVLWLYANRLQGPVPAQLGNLTNLVDLNLAYNGFNHTIPAELRFLHNLVRLDLRYNQLTATDDELLRFLAEKAPAWAVTQTLAPTAVGATPHRSDAIALAWSPIAYGHDGGAYEVESATDAAGPFTLHGRTVDKRSPGYLAEGLRPNQRYYFRVRTVTPPHNLQYTPLVSDYTPVVSATTTALPVNGDPYENDDLCTAARALVTDGRSADHSFHQPGDQDWVRFAVQQHVTYRIDVQTPAASQADVVLKLYASCADSEPETVDLSFSPGIQYTFIAPETGAIYLQLTNSDRAAGGSAVAYQVAVRAVDGETGSGAVILLAGRLTENDSVQANIEAVTQQLYQTLIANGYRDDDIYYLSTTADLPGVDALATTANLHYAVTTWAKARISDERGLTLYLMDHGDKGVLYVDEVNGQRLTPAQLDDWLSQLEVGAPDAPINILIEACYSGTFIRNAPNSGRSLSKPGRVIITSTNLEYLAYASAEGAYFSDHLITALRQGHHLFSGFWEARIATRRVTALHQDPWIEADGDGIPNELEDAAIAARRTLFAPSAQVTSTLLPPYIAALEALPGSNGQPHIAAEVRDNQAVARVWALLYPPGYTPPTAGNELAPEALPNRPLTLEGDRYLLNDGDFTQAGTYRVVVHAEDNDGLRARPVELTVNITEPVDRGATDIQRHQIFLPLVNR